MSKSPRDCPFQKQAKHNERFHNSTCEHFPDDFYDWKITTLFYTAIHYVKALSNQLDIELGDSHMDIRAAIKKSYNAGNKSSMEFSKNAYGWYDYLYLTSRTSRYSGFTDTSGIFTDAATFQAIMQEEHKMCLEALSKLKKYIIENRGLSIE